jgi:hypothetical protein
MANQVDPATMGAAASESASRQAAVAAQEEANYAHGGGQVDTAAQQPLPSQLPYPSYHGRPVSWVAVSIIMAGFLVGGLAMVFGHGGPIWWLFWVGAGASALGLLIMLATRTFEDWY